MATQKQPQPVEPRHETAKINGIEWQILVYGVWVMAVSPQLGENPGIITPPYPVSKDWGAEPIGRWYAPDAFGGIGVGFILSSGLMWPEARKLPLQIVLEYAR